MSEERQETQADDQEEQKYAFPIQGLIKTRVDAVRTSREVLGADFRRLSSEVEDLRNKVKETRGKLQRKGLSKDSIEAQLAPHNQKLDKTLKDLSVFAEKLAEADKAEAELVKLQIDNLREHGKIQYDLYKHLTTLGTGSILIIVGLLKFLFPDLTNVAGLWLLILSFVFLLFSVIYAYLSMYGHTVSVAGGEAGPTTALTGRTSWSFFIVGLESFVVFVTVNLFSIPYTSDPSLILVILIFLLIPMLPVFWSNYFSKAGKWIKGVFDR